MNQLLRHSIGRTLARHTGMSKEIGSTRNSSRKRRQALAFNENSRVKIPALLHLERLGYKYLSLKDATWDPDTNIFTGIFEQSLLRLNPDATADELAIFKKKIFATLENDDLGQAFFKLLISQSGLKIIDFENMFNNSFNCVTELEFQKGLDSFRPDITLLVNGLPLVFIEVKKPNNKEGILAERNRINTRLSNKNFKKIINLTQFMVFSNNMEYDKESLTPIQGAFYATTSYDKAHFNCFREEQLDFNNSQLLNGNVDEDFILSDTNLVAIKHSPEFQTNKRPDSPTNRILSSMVSMERLAFLLRYGITYAQTYQGLEKHIMRYPQFFASLAIKEKISSGINKGIIWHTQGSGKTALSFYNTRFLRDYFQSKGKVAKFYFIVDRIDLMIQAKNEFTARGIKVNTAESKTEFLSDFTKNQAISNQTGEIEITVVNIQKFSEEASELFENVYDLNIQRVYFIDEAHRSYKPDGSFLANLMTSDRNAILICLTGTPIIGEFATKKIFGNYFHKYFYNSSIEDGYTLRLIREEIETSYKASIAEALANFEIQKGNLDKSTIFAHKTFVKPMLEYIVADLQRSRMLHGDQNIAGMVVCDSSEQAREMYSQFTNSYPEPKQLSAALILHDVGSKSERKDYIEDFKKGTVDLLFVYNMLLTGFDAPRLKKLYLGRLVRDHNLLQALTRVNRPYKDFRFGYIVDFVDISREFEATNSAYFAELQDELGEEMQNYSNLFLSKEEILNSINKIQSDLFPYDLVNAEIFSQQISSIQDKETIRSIITSLENGRNLYNLIRLMQFDDLMKSLDFKKIGILLTEVSNHLALLNLREKVDGADETKMLLNTALEDVMFMFRKEGEQELRIGESKGRARQVREALERNIDKSDPEFLKLFEELRRLLSNSNVNETSLEKVDAEIIELSRLLEQVNSLNQQNHLLAIKYDGDAKFVRVHKLLRQSTIDMNDFQIFTLLSRLKLDLNTIVISNNNILGNRNYFEALITRSLAIIIDENPNYEEFSRVKNLSEYIADEYFKEFEGVVAS